MKEIAASHTELSVGAVLAGGISIGIKNSIGILLTYLLYALTSWIPYLNIGTTIALNDLTAMLGRGESFSPTFIFEDRYRRRIPEYFIMMGLFLAAIVAAAATTGATGILVLGWLLAGPLFTDRQLDGLEALRTSYRLTDGNKLTIFFSFLVFGAIVAVIALIVVFTESIVLMILAGLAALVFGLPIVLGMIAYIYGRLVRGLDYAEPGAEPVDPLAFS